MITKEDLQKLEDDAWQKFQKAYPRITDDTFWGRLRVAVFGKGILQLVWENAWLRGVNQGVDLIMLPPESVPPEPKSGQPESPESHSSSHNPKGGSPDANPSK